MKKFEKKFELKMWALLVGCVSFGLFSVASAQTFATIKLSKTLNENEKALIQKSFQAAQQKKLNPERLSPLFQKYFKSNDLKSIQSYLSARIDLIVSPRAKLWVKTDAPYIPYLPVLVGDNPTPTNHPGLLLWIANHWNSQVQSQLDGELIRSEKMPKVIQLGTDFGRYFPVYGLSILVHEARHSDCELGLSAQTLASWKNSAGLKELSDLIGRNDCGYSHRLCPVNSVNAGKLVCDANLRGAYSYQYVFNRAIVNACENCTFAEKIVMQVFALDAASKIPLSSSLAGKVSETLKRLPKLQKTIESKELINDVLEKLLKQVDEFFLEKH